MSLEEYHGDELIDKVGEVYATYFELLAVNNHISLEQKTSEPEVNYRKERCRFQPLKD